MTLPGEPRWHDADDEQPDAPRLRAVPPFDEDSAASPFDDMVAEVVWHGGGVEKDWDALLRLIFDPIIEQLHDAERAADDGDACPW